MAASANGQAQTIELGTNIVALRNEVAPVPGEAFINSPTYVLNIPNSFFAKAIASRSILLSGSDCPLLGPVNTD